MRLLVFAHTPPPHHGQSYMVELMLRGLRERHPEVSVHHVNCRLSSDLDDVGGIRSGKLVKLVGYCLRAVFVALRHREVLFYYIPAPPKRGALYRDWVVMVLCRPFVRRIVFHWHAMGLGQWIDEQARPLERWLSRRLLSGVDLSMVLTDFNRADAERLRPRRTVVVSNGIPDPCASRSGFKPTSSSTEGLVTLLFLAHCTRDKGLFDAVEGVRLANRTGTRRYRLVVGGSFLDTKEESEFDRLRNEPELQAIVDYRGFLGGSEKEAALEEADLFIFPTYYAAESQPVNLIEAMAWGLPIITTRWRALPGMLPDNYPGLVEPRSPKAIGELLLTFSIDDWPSRLRDHFLKRYSLAAHIDAVHAALKSV